MCGSKWFNRVVAFLTINMAAAAAHAAQINYADFSSTAGLNLQGSAAPSGSVLRLTPSAGGQGGSAWYAVQQTVADNFAVTFQFRITQLSGILDDDGKTGADGLAFVIQNQSATALGGSAAGMGYDNITNSVAVEFDTFRNASYYGDPNGNHISVQTMGTSANTPRHTASLGAVMLVPDMSDGNVHTASILYQPGTLNIFFDGANVLDVPLNLATKLNLNNGKAWVGFTAATWAASENHDILNWSMATVPEPSTFALMGTSAAVLAGLAWRRRRAKA